MGIDVALQIGVTDAGPDAQTNEDRILELPDLGVFAIADGSGGADGAEKAVVAVARRVRREDRRLSQLLGAALGRPLLRAHLPARRRRRA